MERPISATDIARSAPSHKRNTSSLKPAARPLEASITTSYITNLRLLNLDLLPDWPGITASSLGNHDARIRLRCSEWSLYQLFRLYDPHTTAEKLQPFFPPLEPLQSINLRAALYRALNDLKKSGVLGRDTVLRKTMLDDCSGEKFYEVCLAFSAVLLRKSISQSKRSPRYARPVAQKLGTAQALSKREKESLLPLALAHKAALTTILAGKQRKRESYMRLYNELRESESELLRRKHDIIERAESDDLDAPTPGLKTVEQTLRRNWLGSDGLANAMLHGDLQRESDQILLQPTKVFLEGIGKDSARPESERIYGAIEDIGLKAKAQNERVKRWKALYDKLNADRRESVQNLAQNGSTKTVDLRFDQHHDLGVDDVQPQPIRSPSRTAARPGYITRYDEILTTMRDELRHAHKAHREAAAAAAAAAIKPPLRQPSITLDAVAGAQQQQQHALLSRSPSQRSVSPSLPLRPGFNRRVSSRSRSYQQPKVISQREPIPLKSELFSPLKSHRRSSTSPASASSSLFASPTEDAPPATGIDGLVSGRSSKRESQSSVVTTAVDSGIGLGVDWADSPKEMEQPFIESFASSSDDATDFKKPGLPPLRAMNVAPRPSLAERTRMSIAFTNPEDTRVDPPAASNVATNMTSPQNAGVNPDSEPALSSLAERTRQSISTTVPFPRRANSTSKRNGPIHVRASSHAVPPASYSLHSQHASNTTKNHQTSISLSEIDHQLQNDAANLGPGNAPARARRNITPREKLFDASAGYDSVFKSRPKIAVSPVLSPKMMQEEEVDANGQPREEEEEEEI